jgi:DNA-directed RNA polymerase subunit alpha
MFKPSFKIEVKKEKKNYAKLVFEPLEQGYGHTLGNSLRRGLLTSLAGTAVTRVKIDGVQHQFSTLKGMKEDIVDFILNLKDLRFVYNGDKEVKLSLSVKGKKIIKGSDIKTPAEVKIVNKDKELAELTNSKASLNAQIWIKKGYGYEADEEQKSDTLGVIAVDAAFTPITRVNYKVEATRVGRRTDFDRLILEVWTDSTIKPKEAVEKVAKIMTSYFKQVYSPVFEKKEEDKEENHEDNEVMKLTVEELNLPTRIANALRRGGYPTVKDLVQASKEDLSKVKNLGAKSIDVIKKKLKAKDVFLKE